MIKKLLFLFLCLSTCIGSWGQSASFDTSTPGMLKIKASGDLTNYTIHDEVTTTVFTSAAEGNIFTGTASNTGVTAGAVYNPSATYYHIGDITYGEALNSGKPGDGDYTYYTVATSEALKTAYAGYRLIDAYYYEGWMTSGNVISISAVKTGSSSEHGSYYKAMLVNGDVPTGTSFGTEAGDDGTLTYNGVTVIPLSPANWSNYFEEVTTITPKSGANLYVSVNNGEKVGKSSAFLWEDDMTIYNATLGENVAIENNETYFASTGAAYIQDNTTPLNTEFKTALTEMLASGSYTTVVFEQDGGAITIDPAIVQIIVNQAGVVTADFGAATTTTYGNLLGSTLATSLNYITFPLTQMTGEDMIFPAGVYNNFQWRDQAMNVTIPNGFTKVADNAFKIPSDNRSYGIKALVSVVLPTTLVEIGNCAFMSAANLTSVTYIGYTGDKDIAFPSTLRKIGIEAFSGDDKLVNFDLNSGLEFIGNSAFYLNHTVGGQAPTLDFPASLKYLGPGSFLNRDYAEIYFHGEIAPICPVGPYYDNSVFYNQDATAFTAATHMGNNGFIPDATKIGGDNANIGYANRENYQNNGTYFTVLHFPEGISIENAKTYKDVTRRYETVEDLSTFVYNASYIPCGEEPEDNVRSFQDHGAQSSWAAAGDFHITTAGHIDTYLGHQKIWPSQPQWMRAYCTVANGVEWNGVNQYRPTITSDMLALMAEDGLKLWDGTKYVAVGRNEYTFTAESADAYNLSHFPEYWNENTIKVPAVLYSNDQVDNYNFENVEGAIQEGQTLYYTQKEIDDHNANFDGARHAGYVEKGRPAGYMTWEEYILTPTMVAMAPNYKNSWGADLDINSYNDKIAGMKANPSAGLEAFGLPVDPRTPATPDYTYTEEDARDYNYAHCSEYGIEPWVAPKEKGIATRETAAAYNLTLPGAWQYGRVMTPATHYTAEQIAAHNANITGLVHEGEPASVNDAMADYISKIAYQATRRFVLADDGSYIPSEDDEYEIPMLGHNWWTICLPFSMTKAEVDDVFGEGTHVCLFSGVDRDAKSATKHITLKFQNDVYVHKTAVAETAVEGKGTLRTYSENFNPDAAAPGDDDIVIQAFEAYMIYPQNGSGDAATFYVPNPRVEQGAPYPTIVEANKAVNGNVPAYANSEDHTEYRFVGNLLARIVQENDNGEQVLVTNKIPQYSYMYAQKKGDANYKFWFNKSATITWPVKKCVVQATAKDGGAADSNNFFGENNTQAKQTSIFGDFYDEYNSDNETTEIENVTIIAGEGKDSQVIYNLNGQQIYSAPNKGVYIKNGKKHITR